MWPTLDHLFGRKDSRKMLERSSFSEEQFMMKTMMAVT